MYIICIRISDILQVQPRNATPVRVAKDGLSQSPVLENVAQRPMKAFPSPLMEPTALLPNALVKTRLAARRVCKEMFLGDG